MIIMYDTIQSLSSPVSVSVYTFGKLRRKLDDNGAWNLPGFLVRSANVFTNCPGVAAHRVGFVDDFQRKVVCELPGVFAEVRLIT